VIGAPCCGQELQLDNFGSHCDEQRPHRAWAAAPRWSPSNARLKATPSLPTAPTHYRVRQDPIDSHGIVTLPYAGCLRNICFGVRHRNREVHLRVAGDDLRIVTNDGQLIR
jgi:hypothetical protein